MNPMNPCANCSHDRTLHSPGGGRCQYQFPESMCACLFFRPAVSSRPEGRLEIEELWRWLKMLYDDEIIAEVDWAYQCPPERNGAKIALIKLLPIS